MNNHSLQRFLIQIERREAPLSIEVARSMLEPTGVKVDIDYGPILVNRKLGRYVVRGIATPEAKSKAEKLDGVRFFSDGQVSATNS